MLLSDDLITIPLWGRHAVERSHRTPDEAARPARPHDRGAGRQYGEGGAALEYRAARHFEIDRGTGARARRAPPRPQPPGRRADRVRSRVARLRTGRIR